MPANERRIGGEYCFSMKDGVVLESMKIPNGEEWTVVGVWLDHVTATYSELTNALTEEGYGSSVIAYAEANVPSGYYHNMQIAEISAAVYAVVPALIGHVCKGGTHLVARGDANTGIAVFVRVKDVTKEEATKK